MGGMEAYEKDFEEPLLAETAAYYKRKAAEWISEDSCPDYMQKAEDVLKQEEVRERPSILIAPLRTASASSTSVCICGSNQHARQAADCRAPDIHRTV